MFQDVEEGKADLIDLAQRANQLFAPDPERARGGGGTRQPDPEPGNATAHATPEEFRAALELSSTGGPGSRLATTDRTLLQRVRIGMRGTVSGPDTGSEREKD